MITPIASSPQQTTDYQLEPDELALDSQLEASVELTPEEEEQNLLYHAMSDDVHNWGIGLLILGAISLVMSSFLDPFWGGVMVLIGLLSFIIRHRFMFIVFGTALLSAGLSNFSGGGFGGWSIFGILQLVWAVQEFRKYGKYSSLNQGSLWHYLRNENHGLLGIISSVGAVAMILFFNFLMLASSALELLAPTIFDLDSVYGLVIGGAMLLLFVVHAFCVLIGIGGLLQLKRRKVLALLGSAFNALIVVGYVALFTLS